MPRLIALVASCEAWRTTDEHHFDILVATAELGICMGALTSIDNLKEAGVDCTANMPVVYMPHGGLRAAADPGMLMNSDAALVWGEPSGGVPVFGTETLSDVSVLWVVVPCKAESAVLCLATGKNMAEVS